MRVAVTGMDGFTGRYVAAALTDVGHTTINVHSDITDSDALAAEIADIRPEACIHLAAIAFIDQNDFRQFYEVNQIGTFNLLNAISQFAPGSSVLIPSSAQVYGSKVEGLVNENASFNPPNHYALSKVAMELGAKLWNDKIKIIITRPFNYTGIGQEVRYLIPKIVDHFKRRATKIELGNIDIYRDFGDVRAVASAYAQLIGRPVSGSPINIATGKLYSIRDVIALAGTITGHSIEICTNPAFIRMEDVPRLGGVNHKLRSALPGWEPIALRDTLQWMLSERQF